MEPHARLFALPNKKPINCSEPLSHLGAGRRAFKSSDQVILAFSTRVCSRFHRKTQNSNVTKARLDSLISTYKTLLIEAGIRPQQVDITRHLSRSEMLSHCLWVLEQKIEPVLHRIGGFQEAIRLLGCIQGTVMACGLCTISETREHANQAGLPTWQQILDEEE
jgi:hypothetical protein